MKFDFLSLSSSKRFAKKYVNSTADSLGAVKGAPCTIKSIEPIENEEGTGNKVTFEWTNSYEEKETSEMIVMDGKDSSGSGVSGDASDILFNNEAYPQYQDVNSALSGVLDKLFYVKPTCKLSADKTGGTFEIGTVITAPIKFTWETNKAIKTQTLTDCSIDSNLTRSASYNSNISSNRTFTLTVSDGENSATSSISYSFLNNIFWGSAAEGTYNSDFINSLANKSLKSTIKGTYIMTVESGEYGFWAVPSSMSIDTVWIGGFEVTVDYVSTISYTNSKGYTRDYNIYKTNKSGLGTITAEIK